MMDERHNLLQDWVRLTLQQPNESLIAISGDASFRRYFRTTHNTPTYIAVDAPPQQEDCHPFVHVAKGFLAMGLNVPQVIAVDYTLGTMLLSDLGDSLYLNKLNDKTADRYYQSALDALLKIQGCTIDIPSYDKALLYQEMSLFKDWFIQHHLQHPISAEDEQLLQTTFRALADNALNQPQVCVHRDYHSRNLMVTPTNLPGILDFQDAVQGPITYDLVSLLRDCYITWPQKKVETWALQYYQRLHAAKLLDVSVSATTFMQWFDWMGIQRHLKAIGIFARLHHRDNKSHYLKDIPTTYNYVLEVSQRYHQLADFSHWLTHLRQHHHAQLSAH